MTGGATGAALWLAAGLLLGLALVAGSLAGVVPAHVSVVGAPQPRVLPRSAARTNGGALSSAVLAPETAGPSTAEGIAASTASSLLVVLSPVPAALLLGLAASRVYRRWAEAE